jgi:hypothetical protein
MTSFKILETISVKNVYNVDDLGLSCNANCNCNPKEFKPVCGDDNVMYFSSCYAGCAERQLNRLSI